MPVVSGLDRAGSCTKRAADQPVQDDVGDAVLEIRAQRGEYAAVLRAREAALQRGEERAHRADPASHSRPDEPRAADGFNSAERERPAYGGAQNGSLADIEVPSAPRIPRQAGDTALSMDRLQEAGDRMQQRTVVNPPELGC